MLGEGGRAAGAGDVSRRLARGGSGRYDRPRHHLRSARTFRYETETAARLGAAVSEIGFGAWAIGGSWGEVDEATRKRR